MRSLKRGAQIINFDTFANRKIELPQQSAGAAIRTLAGTAQTPEQEGEPENYYLAATLKVTHSSTLIIARLNAGMSLGFRLVTKPSSLTTS
jgi:hypothetical protein